MCQRLRPAYFIPSALIGGAPLGCAHTIDVTPSSTPTTEAPPASNVSRNNETRRAKRLHETGCA